MEGNQMKMREACKKMCDLVMLRGDGKSRCVLTWDEFNESQKMLRAALAAQPRNCDVGTPEEQADRHYKWCGTHHCTSDLKESGDCGLCFARWAQMPYEEKGEGDGR